MAFRRICLSLLVGLAGSVWAAGPELGVFDTGTSFFVTKDSVESTQWKLELIRNAKQSIELSANYAGGKDYIEALRLMGEAMERNPNLQVHLVFDTILMDALDKTRTAEMAQKYPRQFHAVQESKETQLVDKGATIANHLKILVVDEKYFVVGGTSLEQSLSTEGLHTEPMRERDTVPTWASYAGARDMDIVGVGSMAQTLRKVYFVTHARFEQLVLTGRLERSDAALQPYNRYTPVNPAQSTTIPAVDGHAELIRGPRMKLIVSSPFDGGDSLIAREYVRLIDGATRSIDIGNLYYMPTRSIANAMMDAGNRGLVISVITNGVNDRSPFPTTLFGWGTRYGYFPVMVGVELEGPDYFFADEIPSNNTQVWEYYVDKILYHKKVMVIDGQTLLIGSYNLGKKSEVGDYELAITIESSQAAQKVLQVLEVDRAHSRSVSRSEATDYYFAPWYAPLGKAQQELGGVEL